MNLWLAFTGLCTERGIALTLALVVALVLAAASLLPKMFKFYVNP